MAQSHLCKVRIHAEKTEQNNNTVCVRTHVNRTKIANKMVTREKEREKEQGMENS